MLKIEWHIWTGVAAFSRFWCLLVTMVITMVMMVTVVVTSFFALSSEHEHVSHVWSACVFNSDRVFFLYLATLYGVQSLTD